MISFKDKTFCASPECKNECGRQLNDKEKDELNYFKEQTGFSMPVSYAYFCGEPKND